jgi:hypothetical protein
MIFINKNTFEIFILETFKFSFYDGSLAYVDYESKCGNMRDYEPTWLDDLDFVGVL